METLSLPINQQEIARQIRELTQDYGRQRSKKQEIKKVFEEAHKTLKHMTLSSKDLRGFEITEKWDKIHNKSRSLVEEQKNFYDRVYLVKLGSLARRMSDLK